MYDQLVITEKTSQARDVRAAVGSGYGTVLPAEGHLFDLQEPEDVVPAWKRWTAVLLRPDALYGTRPASGGNKAAKLKAIKDALRSARRVWLATDCDREGQLIGQEILEHLRFRGEIMRVMFTAQDPQTIRDAFARAKPNRDFAPLYAAAVARRQADQIYNLSLTRTATVTLATGRGSVIGIGRVKTPTLGIVCRRELEIRAFVPEAYHEVVATASVAAGQFQMRHAPKERIKTREAADAIAAAAAGYEGPLGFTVEEKRQAPPRLHDLPSLQKLCGSRFGWSAARTLEVAQELYDGAGKKVITYPRSETRHLPESLIDDAPRIVAALQAGQSFAAIPVPQPPVIRRGTGGVFSDRALAGASHHAVIPNVNTAESLQQIWPRLSTDERRLFDIVARSYLAAVMPDFRYRQTSVTLDVDGCEFRATGRQPIELGWRAAFPDWQPQEERGADAQLLPAMRGGEATRLSDLQVESKETRPPPRYNEGTLIDAMLNAWRFVADESLRERLKEAKGIGTPATRGEVIGGLKAQDFLALDGKHIVPTERGLVLHGVLQRAAPALVDPGVTAQMEHLLDDVLLGRKDMMSAIDAVCEQASRIIERLTERGTSDMIPAALIAKAAPGRSRPASPARRFGSSETKAPASRRRIEVVSGPEPVSAPTPRTVAKRQRSTRSILADARDTNPDLIQARPKTTAPKPRAGKTSSSVRPSKRPATNGDAGVSGAETPLRIPFGNKDEALTLGARYRAGGWYAPANVPLAPFKERSWL